MGQVGVDPTMPVAADLQSAPFADSVLTHKYKTQMQYVAYSEIIKIVCMAVQVFKWSSEPDLNRRPHPYQGCALPAELSEHIGAETTNRTSCMGLKTPYRL